MKTLARLLQEYEATNGLSVGEAATRVLGSSGIKNPRRVYYKWRREGAVPQPPQLKKLSEGLGIPVEELLDAVEETLMKRATRRAHELRRQAGEAISEDPTVPPQS